MDFFKFNTITLRLCLYLGMALLSVGFSLLDFPELLLYFVGFHLLYTILVSMLIEGWKQDGKILVESNIDNWVSYFAGLPVEENNFTLRNLHFKSPDDMTSIYLKLLLPKAILAIVLAIVLISHTFFGEHQIENFAVLISIFVLSLGFLITRTYVAVRPMIIAINKQWEIQNHERDNITYGSAYIKNGESYTPFLAEVFR